MSHKIKTTKTAEQRHAQAQALQASIATQVEQLHNSETWRRFLDFAEAFHAYSLNNVLLILAQYPTATQVAGFRKWQDLGRQVRRGERSIKIFDTGKRRSPTTGTTTTRSGRSPTTRCSASLMYPKPTSSTLRPATRPT